jgi:hypothetical protein
MSERLADLLRAELSEPAPEPVVAFARHLADAWRDAAVLYYGSTLRGGDLTGVLDFYRLTRSPHRRGLRGLVERALWPEVSYHEFQLDGRTPLAVFRRAAAGDTLDTTVWTRFVQPARLVWAADEASASQAREAVADAVKTASRFAAALGPAEGEAGAFWTALFRSTYAAEFRVENPERADQVTTWAAERYAELLPLAWLAAGVRHEASGAQLRPSKAGLPGWRLRAMAGKPLNIARLAKAAFTFEGGARYAAWKIARHTGVEIEVTPMIERFPLIAAPAVLWKLRKRQAEARRLGSRPNS